MLHHVELTLTPTDPTALERVVATCRARRCAVVALAFETTDAAGRLRMTVDGDPGRVRHLLRRLGGLVGVLDADGAPSGPAGGAAADVTAARAG
ncbi:hypothetical protein [Patulibacter sp. SYSU D01012]|uniref:hypothetical protein n=1 Tax=Patulibacter sp. SYSU D01012 TaxID=2817381 RepID=UPI001B314346|nr:hypothetical protein [Patulibacter sp. SYSU D01012]